MKGETTFALFLGQHDVRSYKVLKQWLKLLGRPAALRVNASRKKGKVTWRDYDLDCVKYFVEHCTKYVALGKYAAGLYDILGVKYFELPHPIGLSRKHKDRVEVARQLQLCRLYLES